MLVSSSYQTFFRLNGARTLVSLAHPSKCMVDLVLQSLVMCTDRRAATTFASPDSLALNNVICDCLPSHAQNNKFQTRSASASLRLSESLEFIILCCVVKSLGWFLFFFLSQSSIFVICVHSGLVLWLFCTLFLLNFVHSAVVFYLDFIYNTSCRGELQ